MYPSASGGRSCPTHSSTTFSSNSPVLEATLTMKGIGEVAPAGPIRISIRWYMYAPASVNFDIDVAVPYAPLSSRHETDRVGPPEGVPRFVLASTERNVPDR